VANGTTAGIPYPTWAPRRDHRDLREQVRRAVAKRKQRGARDCRAQLRQSVGGGAGISRGSWLRAIDSAGWSPAIVQVGRVLT
jgi:hypothetical protein